MRNRQISTCPSFFRHSFKPLVAVLAVSTLSACPLFHKPQSPQVVGLRLTRFTPGASKGDKVMVPIELKIINPNEEQLEIRGTQIRIITKEGETERTLGVASFETPVIVGPGKKGSDGKATAQLLASEGAQVLGMDINGDGNEETAKRIKDAGGEAHAIVGDVTVAEDWAGALDEALSRFGKAPAKRGEAIPDENYTLW